MVRANSATVSGAIRSGEPGSGVRFPLGLARLRPGAWGRGVDPIVGRMAKRFESPDGRRWMVWSVLPGQHTSTALRSRNRLPGGLEAGWLCFDTEGEKRRLVPVPDAWEAVEDDGLWALCGSACPVVRRAAAVAGPQGRSAGT